MPATRSVPLGPVALLLCFQYFVAEAIARAGWTLPYSARSNFISDLGAVQCVTTGLDPVCSPLHAVMNGAFVLQGFLIVAGAAFSRRHLPSGRAISTACALLVMSGIALALVGVFPEDVNPPVHRRVAAVHFILGDLAMLLVGIALTRLRQDLRGFGVVTLSCAALAILGLGLLGARVDGGIGIGAIERLAAYPFTIWLSITGATLLARRAGERT